MHNMWIVDLLGCSNDHDRTLNKESYGRPQLVAARTNLTRLMERKQNKVRRDMETNRWRREILAVIAGKNRKNWHKRKKK